MGWFIASAPETAASNRAIGKLNFWLAGFSYAEDELNEFRTFLAQDFVTVVEYDGLQRPYAPDFSYYLQARYERPSSTISAVTWPPMAGPTAGQWK